jgi:hypothetical protein
MAIIQGSRTRVANGAALAAFLAAGIGAFAMGSVVILNEAGLFTAPAVYGPAGGVSGRTTIATVIWLIAWGVLHRRWKDRDMDPGPMAALTLVLTALGILLTFPPLWSMM